MAIIRCDIVIETKGDNVSGYDFAEFDPTTNPAQLNNIVSPITVNGYPNAGFFNSVGFNRLNGLFYGLSLSIKIVRMVM